MIVYQVVKNNIWKRKININFVYKLNLIEKFYMYIIDIQNNFLYHFYQKPIYLSISSNGSFSSFSFRFQKPKLKTS